MDVCEFHSFKPVIYLKVNDTWIMGCEICTCMEDLSIGCEANPCPTEIPRDCVELGQFEVTITENCCPKTHCGESQTLQKDPFISVTHDNFSIF